MKEPFILLSVTLLLFSIIIFSTSSPVFANNVADSSPMNAKNYAMIQVRANCASFGGDSDNDGICNDWEKTSDPGLHINFTDSSQGTTTVRYAYILPCNTSANYITDQIGATVCPDPNKKDIYIELDYMTGHNPSMQPIIDVVQAFNAQNIALHVQFGENVTSSQDGNIQLHYCDVNWGVLGNRPTGGSAGQACSSSTTNYQSYPYLKQNKFGTSAERSGVTSICPRSDVPTNYQSAGAVANKNSYNCLTAKRQVFHYGMFANYQYNAITSSGTSEVNGNDFLVTLGNFANNGNGTIDNREASFMHELGHNFGLGHGGLTSTGVADQNNNCKPNYLSVMSYTYLFRNTADVCRPLDYSSSKLSDLDETPNNLKDTNIGSSQYPANNPNPPDDPNRNPACDTNGQRKIFWSNGANIIQSTTGSVEDWNQNGVDTTQSYSQILNNMPPQCSTTSTAFLNGTDDWSYIKNGNSANTQPLNFRPSSNFWNVARAGNDDDIASDAHTDYANEESWTTTPSIHFGPRPCEGADCNPIPAIGIGIGAIAIVTGIGIYSTKRKK